MAEKYDEVFELVDDDDRVVGQALRGAAHAHGLLHRAAYGFVFRAADGALLLQRRAAAKTIAPGAWDLSVAEHLQPGETYRAAVARGLREELGIAAPEAALAEAAGTHRRELHEGAVHDVELVRSYVLRGYAGGEPAFDDGEVSEARWAPLAALRAEVAAAPEAFTPWMRDELELLGWFQGWFEGGPGGPGSASVN